MKRYCGLDDGTILIADDDKQKAGYIRRWTGESFPGLKIEVAGNLAGAMQFVRESIQKLRIVLTDSFNDGRSPNGITLIETVRQLEPPDIHVFVASVTSHWDDREREPDPDCEFERLKLASLQAGADHTMSIRIIGGDWVTEMQQMFDRWKAQAGKVWNPGERLQGE